MAGATPPPAWWAAVTTAIKDVLREVQIANFHEVIVATAAENAFRCTSMEGDCVGVAKKILPKLAIIQGIDCWCWKGNMGSLAQPRKPKDGKGAEHFAIAVKDTVTQKLYYVDPAWHFPDIVECHIDGAAPDMQNDRISATLDTQSQCVIKNDFSRDKREYFSGSIQDKVDVSTVRVDRAAKTEGRWTRYDEVGTVLAQFKVKGRDWPVSKTSATYFGPRLVADFVSKLGTTFSDTIKTNVAKSFFESDEEVVTNFYLKFCAATEASEFFIARTAVSEGMHHISPHLITVQDGIREQVLAWIPGTPEILYLRLGPWASRTQQMNYDLAPFPFSDQGIEDHCPVLHSILADNPELRVVFKERIQLFPTAYKAR